MQAELGGRRGRARTSTPSCCGSRRPPRPRRSARPAARRSRRSAAASPRPRPAWPRAAPRRRDPGSGSRRRPGSARTAPRRAAGPASSTSVVIASAWRRCTFVTRARTVSPGSPRPHEDDEAVEPRATPFPPKASESTWSSSSSSRCTGAAMPSRLQAEEREARLEADDLHRDAVARGPRRRAPAGTAARAPARRAARRRPRRERRSRASRTRAPTPCSRRARPTWRPGRRAPRKKSSSTAARISVPKPRRWKRSPSHDPVSAVRVAAKSFASSPWRPHRPARRTTRRAAGASRSRRPALAQLPVERDEAVDEPGLADAVRPRRRRTASRSGGWTPCSARCASSTISSSVGQPELEPRRAEAEPVERLQVGAAPGALVHVVRVTRSVQFFCVQVRDVRARLGHLGRVDLLRELARASRSRPPTASAPSSGRRRRGASAIFE